MVSSKEEQFRSSLLAWASENTRDFPWREPDRSLYDVFVAEFFLTQTPANNVAAVYTEFLDEFPSLEAIEAAHEDDLAEVIEPLGFYNIRSRALKEIAEENDGLPDTTDELLELPRVGEYVANATLCFANDATVPILDRNVERIYSRVFGEDWPDTSPEQLSFAEELVPRGEARRYNLALLDFGAAICKPEPLCEECFATGYCEYYQEQVK